MISYQEALQLVLDRLHPLSAVELPLEQTGGLVLAEAVHARWDLPSADNSAMDGFAFAWEERIQGAELPVVGRAYAGSPWSGSVGSGKVVRIMTGSPLPDGCDTVVPLEDVIETGKSILLPANVKKGQHVRRKAEEFRNGDRLLDAGSVLHAGEIGLLAAAGIDRVRVHPKPQVALLSTGDELVELGHVPGPGQVVNSNFYLLSARLRETGCNILPLGVSHDEPEALSRQLARGEAADLLISTGGVSVGDRDYLRRALGGGDFETVFWKVAIKPGKPVLFGLLRGKPVFGLPGNPAAAAATFELFVLPALRRLAGHPAPFNETRRGRLAETVSVSGDRQAFLWCRLEWIGDCYIVHMSKRQGSGQNLSLQGANALLAVPTNVCRLEVGELVEVQLLRV